METSAQGQFPMFRDGDVLVILDKSHFYKLHSYVLRRQVPVMAELLMENKGAMLSAQARKDGNSLRWRIDLHAIPDPDASWDIDVKFVQGVSHVFIARAHRSKAFKLVPTNTISAHQFERSDWPNS